MFFIPQCLQKHYHVPRVASSSNISTARYYINYHSFFLHVPTQLGLRILEALSASGLRSIRYALEVPLAQNIVANDLSHEAYVSMQRNIAHNQVGGRVRPSCREAR